MIKCFNAARTFMSVSPFHLWLCPLHLKSSSSQGCKMNAIRFQKTILAGSDPEGEGAPLASAIQQTSFALLWLEQLRSCPLLIPMTKEILWEIWSWATHLSLEHSWGQGRYICQGVILLAQTDGDPIEAGVGVILPGLQGYSMLQGSGTKPGEVNPVGNVVLVHSQHTRKKYGCEHLANTQPLSASFSIWLLACFYRQVL